MCHESQAVIGLGVAIIRKAGKPFETELIACWMLHACQGAHETAMETQTQEGMMFAA